MVQTYRPLGKPESRLIFAILVVFGVAITFRALYLGYNLFVLDIPPYWPWPARMGLALALSEFGTIDLGPGYEQAFKISVAEAMDGWTLVERGIVLPFLFFKRILGTVEYLHVQAL